MNRQAGYSLVELVTVLTVVGILTTMAAGSFASYNAKSQTMEAMKITENMRAAYLTEYTEAGKVPPLVLADLYGTGDGSIATHHIGKYVQSVNMDGGDIVVTFGLEADPQLDTRTLVLSAYESISGNLLWRCGNAPIPTDGTTQLSRAGARVGSPATGTLITTTVPDEFLPRACRP